MRALLLALTVFGASLVTVSAREPENLPGPLIVVGGGGTPDVAIARAMALVGAGARVAVLPHASSLEDRGEESAQMWRDAGAGEVRNLDEVPGDEARSFLAQADFVWFPGGDQERLMTALRDLDLLDAVRAAHSRGALVGGTSAGAAVMSARMIAGPPSRDGLVAGAAKVSEGLGLWPGVVVDQHFVQRDRYGRLIAAVLDAPSIVGVGISERTAAVVTFERVDDDEPAPSLEVIGESTVVVVDARRAAIHSGERTDGLHAARGLVMDVLPAGERWRP